MLMFLLISSMLVYCHERLLVISTRYHLLISRLPPFTRAISPLITGNVIIVDIIILCLIYADTFRY